jgi:DNA-binding GntR family transcriptional regulator
MAETDDVVTALRAAILRGRFAAGQRLIETELVAQLNSSRFLVRNALMQLVADGLVELQPNRGARVREISLPEAIEITELRAPLEGLVAAKAAERITDEEVVELRDLGTAMSDAVASAQLLRYSDLNRQLHDRLLKIANQHTASRIIQQLNWQVVQHQFRLALVPGRPAVSLPEHLAIIDAVSSRDAQAAETAMRAHIESVKTALQNFADAPSDLA